MVDMLWDLVNLLCNVLHCVHADILTLQLTAIEVKLIDTALIRVGAVGTMHV